MTANSLVTRQFSKASTNNSTFWVTLLGRMKNGTAYRDGKNMFFFLLWLLFRSNNLKQWTPYFADGIHESQGSFKDADIILTVRKSLPLPHNPIEGSSMGNPSSFWTPR